VHRTHTNGKAINIEYVGSIDGLTYCESIDLSCEGIYLHPQISIFLNLLDAFFLGDTGRFIPRTRKIPLLRVVEQLIRSLVSCIPRRAQKCSPIHRLDHTMVGLSQSLVKELNKSPFLISLWRASYQ
jgi:hypothetical protein